MQLVMIIQILILVILFCTVNDTTLYVSGKTLSARENQKLSKRLSKRFERSVYWNEYKTKTGNTANEFRYFLESNFVRVNR